MLVQFNSDHNIVGSSAVADDAESAVRAALGGLADKITRVEIHVSDENGASKSGHEDKQCRMEARLAGRPPIAVRAAADSVGQSVAGAAHKLRHAVETVVGRAGKSLDPHPRGI